YDTADYGLQHHRLLSRLTRARPTSFLSSNEARHPRAFFMPFKDTP
ncbi:MAG: hypothetical protein RLZZ341_1294, partial [Pseudomonadota bacterium]